MISDFIVQCENLAKQSGLIGHAKRLMQNLGWLSPISSLASKGGKDFGRRIEASLAEISQGRGIMRCSYVDVMQQ